jgi:hypothetical protein
MDEDLYYDANGYRERFLRQLLKPEYKRREAGSFMDEEDQIRAAPDRYRLATLIAEDNAFPLSGATDILEECYSLQHNLFSSSSFINLTARYNKNQTAPLTPRHSPPGTTVEMVILVSDNFDLEEAVLFWNLRADGTYVAWLQFSQFEDNLDAIVKWLGSDYGGLYYSLVKSLASIVFSSRPADLPRLQVLVAELETRRQRNYLEYEVKSSTELIAYARTRPYELREYLTVTQERLKYIFIPAVPEDITPGEHAITLMWDELMIPRSTSLVGSSTAVKPVRFYTQSNNHLIVLGDVQTSYSRITKDRFVRLHISGFNPKDLIEFSKASTDQLIKALFDEGGFLRVELSSTARYHQNFVDRANGLEEAARYIATPPYRDLLELLSDNTQRNKRGWILDKPDKRRVLHHIDLRHMLNSATPSETQRYFDTVSDILPGEAIELLEKGLLERGFVLGCSTCSYRAWYPAEHVGQTFECSRCFQKQVCTSNPLWLYKLPEVIFLGFAADNMQVPLLTLRYLQRQSQHYFEWVPDSNVYESANQNKPSGNIDVLCLSDGRLYIGEAKSNDRIEVEQLSFYEDVCKRVAVDGIVFATSMPHWSRGTLDHIERLRATFGGEVLVLTSKDLYSGTAQEQ